MKYINHIVLISFIAFLISACSDQVQDKKEVIRPVKYEVIGKVNARKTRTFSGVASAGNEIELSFRSGGIISQFNVKVGQRVKKGTLLARLDNVQANLAYDQSISALNAAQSAMNTAKSGLERSKALYEQGSQSLSDYESAKNSFQSALDQHESAKRNKDIKQSQIDYGFIYAPKDGVVAVKNGGLNENVSAGQVIVVLNAGQEMQIKVGLPGSVINKVQLGMQTDLIFSSLEPSGFKGTVIEVAPIVNANASTFPVKVEIANPVEAIKPGMVADVTFTFGSNENSVSNSLIVPVKSVGEDGDGNFVFVIESSDGMVGTVKKQQITLGELTNEGFVISAGLEEGQKVATAGLQTLLDGQKVKL